jgi:hypothetical protein
VRGTSSVLWKNDPPGEPAGLEHSIVETDPAPGSTNRNVYPIFRDPGGWFRPREGGSPVPGGIPDPGVWVPGDYRILVGSPAADGGDPADPADPDDTRADAGAFFLEQPLRAFIRADVDGNGAVEPIDLALLAAALPRSGDLRCADAADLDDDGGVTPADAAWLAALAFWIAPPPEHPSGACGTDSTFGDGLACNRKADPCLGHEQAAR